MLTLFLILYIDIYPTCTILDDYDPIARHMQTSFAALAEWSYAWCLCREGEEAHSQAKTCWAQMIWWVKWMHGGDLLVIQSCGNVSYDGFSDIWCEHWPRLPGGQAAVIAAADAAAVGLSGSGARTWLSVGKCFSVIPVISYYCLFAFHHHPLSVTADPLDPQTNARPSDAPGVCACARRVADSVGTCLRCICRWCQDYITTDGKKYPLPLMTHDSFDRCM